MQNFNGKSIQEVVTNAHLQIDELRELLVEKELKVAALASKIVTLKIQKSSMNSLLKHIHNALCRLDPIYRSTWTPDGESP